MGGAYLFAGRPTGRLSGSRRGAGPPKWQADDRITPKAGDVEPRKWHAGEPSGRGFPGAERAPRRCGAACVTCLPRTGSDRHRVVRCCPVLRRTGSVKPLSLHGAGVAPRRTSSAKSLPSPFYDAPTGNPCRVGRQPLFSGSGFRGPHAAEGKVSSSIERGAPGVQRAPATNPAPAGVRIAGSPGKTGFRKWHPDRRLAWDFGVGRPQNGTEEGAARASPGPDSVATPPVRRGSSGESRSCATNPAYRTIRKKKREGVSMLTRNGQPRIPRPM